MTKLADAYRGWEEHQQLLVAAVENLTDAQLELKAAPHLRSVREIVTHIVGVRAGWFGHVLGAGDADFLAHAGWQRDNIARDASQLVAGLRDTWAMVSGRLSEWEFAAIEGEVRATRPGDKTYLIDKRWIVWHVAEHDVHHGGELLLTLGIHHLPTPDLGEGKAYVREVAQ